MASFESAGVISQSGLSYVSNVTDMAIADVDGVSILYTATGAGGGISVFSIQPSGLTLVEQQGYALGGVVSPIAQVAVLETADGDQLVAFGVYDWNLSRYSISNDGSVGSTQGLTWGANGIGQLSSITSVSIDGEVHVYAASTLTQGLNHYSIHNGNSLSLSDSYSLPRVQQSADIVDIEHVNVAGEDIILTLSQARNEIQSYSVDDQGALTKVTTLNADAFLPVSTPTALETGQSDGNTFAVMASAGTSSLTVLRVEESGNLKTVDHVIDNAWTRFSKVTELAVEQIGDQMFVVAGGADDGLSLFSVLPSGKLVLLDSIADTHGLALQNIASLEMQNVDGVLNIFATSETERGITHIKFAQGNGGLSVVGSGLGNNLTGTTNGDVIEGGSGNDVINGGGGDDIISDGLGQDVMIGGAGADTFFLTADGAVDTIADFESGIDTIDLSDFHMLYDVRALTINSTSWGAEITFRNETIEVHSANGASLHAAQFTTQGVLSLDRPPSGFHRIPDTFFGTDQGDEMVGDRGMDTLYGYAGDDVFLWSEDADVFYGGVGVDTASYQAATSATYVDLGQNNSDGAADGDRFYSIENLIGTPFDDTLIGDAGDNHISAGSGNDFLEGGAGADIVDGGGGIDTASYASSSSGVSVSLLQGGLSQTVIGDQFISIENLVGSNYSDTIEGDNASNNLVGGLGNDVLNGLGGDDKLFGGQGDDIFIGGFGRDRINGGSGFDIVDYSGTLGDIRISLKSGHGSGGAVGNVLTSIEGLIGSVYGDTLTGNADHNDLSGNDGDDILSGDGGNDVLDGGEGNDQIDGGNGHDYLSGDEGDDILKGGTGNDNIYGGVGNDIMVDGGGIDRYDGGGGFDTVDYSAHIGRAIVNLNSGKGSGVATGDRYYSIELVIGGSGPDLLYGSHANDQFDGGQGSDRLYGGGGNDVLKGGSGADFLFGGTGSDTFVGGNGPDLLYGGTGLDIADYSATTSRIQVDLLSQKHSGAAFGDRLISIECVRGTSASDRIYGDNKNNVLWGGSGADVLIGRGGQDWLVGQDGNDFIFGGSGIKHYIGGDGVDTVYLVPMQSRAQVWLSKDEGGLSVAGDKFIGIENIIGTRFSDGLYGDENNNTLRGHNGNDVLIGFGGDDVLVGDAGNDYVYGGAGDDSLIGGTGNDHLFGGKGNDYIHAGSGKDHYIGGDGTDTLFLGKLQTGAVVWLWRNTGAGELSGSTVREIENVTGTRFADSLWGDEADNLLVGKEGNDVLVGRDGADRLIGGSGNDRLYGGAGDDELTGGDGNDLLHGATGADSFIFTKGRDKIVNFEAGIDQIHIQLETGQPSMMEIDSIIDQAIVSDGTIILDFGAAGSLTVQTDLTPLQLQDELFWG